MTLVREHASGTYFREIASKGAFQDAFFVATEIDIILGTKGSQILATGVVVVKAHTAVTGNTPVHLMGNERPQILVPTCALAEPVTAAIMAGHHRHVLQVTVPALFTHRAVVGVVDHQPFHYTGTEGFGFLIVDINAGLVCGRRHAGHHQHALVVVLVLVLFDRALAAGAHTAHGRVPAEIRNIQAEGQTRLEQVVGSIDRIALSIHVNRRHDACLSFGDFRSDFSHRNRVLMGLTPGFADAVLKLLPEVFEGRL